MIKIIFLIIISCFSLTQVFGQYILDTPDGKKVKLSNDGTWMYLQSNEFVGKSSTTPKSSTAMYASGNKKYTIWYDPTQWLYDTTKNTNSLWWDATFYSKDYAITGYCLESRLSMPVDDLETFIRPQWQQAGKITSFTTFKDTINNLPVTGFNMLLEFGGVVYRYRGYIHSTAKGSFQFVVGTQKEVFEEDEEKINQLFKGISKL